MDNLKKFNGGGQASNYLLISYGFNCTSSKTFTAKYSGSIILIRHNGSSSLSINGTSYSANSSVNGSVVYICSVNKGDSVSYSISSSYSYIVLNCNGGAFLSYNSSGSNRAVHNATMSNVCKGRYILAVSTHIGRSDGSSPISTSNILVSTSGTSATVLGKNASGTTYASKIILYETTELSSIKLYDNINASGYEYRDITQIWF